MRSELPSFPLDSSQPLDRSEVETTQHVPAIRAEANGTMEIAAGDVLDVVDVAPKREANGTMEITPGDVLEVTAAAGALAAAPPPSSRVPAAPPRSARVPAAPITAPLPVPGPTPLPAPATLRAPTPLPAPVALRAPTQGALPAPTPLPMPAALRVPTPLPAPAVMSGSSPAWPFTSGPASTRVALPSHSSEPPPVDDAASTWTLQVQAWRRPGPWTGKRLRGALITAGVLGFAFLVSVAALVVHLARLTHASDPADDPTAAATLAGRDVAAHVAEEATTTRDGDGAMSVSTGAAAEPAVPESSSPDALPSASAARSTATATAPSHARRAAASGGQGWLRTNTAERGALVFVDGVLAGKSPAPIHVACGAHNVSVGSGPRHRVVVPCGGTAAVR